MHKAAALLDPRRSLGSPILIGPAIAMALAAGTILYGAHRDQDVDHHASIMQASAPRPTARTISSDALPHVAGKNITTMVVEFPPGGFSPPHHHGGSVTVYVLDGTIRSQLQGGPAMVYTEGQTFFEPPGIAHLLAENVSTTEPARILVAFVADEGATLTTYHE